MKKTKEEEINSHKKEVLKEVLVEIRNFIQERREKGETNLRNFIHFVVHKIEDCDKPKMRKTKGEYYE